MIKKFVAVAGGQCSGILSHDEAIKWGTKQLNQHQQNKSLTVAYIAEVIENVVYETPPIKVGAFIPEPTPSQTIETAMPAKPHPHTRNADLSPERL